MRLLRQLLKFTGIGCTAVGAGLSAIGLYVAWIALSDKQRLALTTSFNAFRKTYSVAFVFAMGVLGGAIALGALIGVVRWWRAYRERPAKSIIKVAVLAYEIVTELLAEPQSPNDPHKTTLLDKAHEQIRILREVANAETRAWLKWRKRARTTKLAQALEKLVSVYACPELTLDARVRDAEEVLTREVTPLAIKLGFITKGVQNK